GSLRDTQSRKARPANVSIPWRQHRKRLALLDPAVLPDIERLPEGVWVWGPTGTHFQSHNCSTDVMDGLFVRKTPVRFKSRADRGCNDNFRPDSAGAKQVAEKRLPRGSVGSLGILCL